MHHQAQRNIARERIIDREVRKLELRRVKQAVKKVTGSRREG